MRTADVFENGSHATSGGDNGDRISPSAIVKVLIGIVGTVLTLLFTRWLDHVDKELDYLKAQIVEVRKDSATRAEAWARLEGKLDFYFQQTREKAGLAVK